MGLHIRFTFESQNYFQSLPNKPPKKEKMLRSKEAKLVDRRKGAAAKAILHGPV
jgi:hypothetical protein